jgi:hypothetical protein
MSIRAKCILFWSFISVVMYSTQASETNLVNSVCFVGPSMSPLPLILYAFPALLSYVNQRKVLSAGEDNLGCYRVGNVFHPRRFSCLQHMLGIRVSVVFYLSLLCSVFRHGKKRQRSHGSSVGIAMDTGWTAGVRFPAG